MKGLNGFWQFLNKDVKDVPWGNVIQQGMEALKTLPDAVKAWEDNAIKIPELAQYLVQTEPLIKALDDPITQLAIAGIPFVSAGINLLKIGLDLAKIDSTLESSVAIVAQLAYLQSLEMVLKRQDNQITAKLEKISLKDIVDEQLAKLDTTELTRIEAKKATTQFKDSVLAQQFEIALMEQLKKSGLEEKQAQQLLDQVMWGSHRYFYQAIAEAGDNVAPLAEYYRTGGIQEQARYDSIDDYLNKQIKPTPMEQVFDESEPIVCFQDIYVRLEVQPLTQEGEVKRNIRPICSHEWTRQILELPVTKPRRVMFMEGEAGRGKSVFCRMIANWVSLEFGDAFIPLRIRLRDLHSIASHLTKTLTECPDLEQVKFVRGVSDWLADKNTRFFIILDGFDELILEGRATGGLKEFLQQVTDFQRRSHHQLLVTGRPLALQGIDRLITQNKDLERVRLEPMRDEVREQWLNKWQAIFGEETVNPFRKFLKACPTDITNNLAREPLLLYLLARLNREGHLTQDMFAVNKKGLNQEPQAKLRIYRESVNWVLEKQRQAENLRLSGLNNLDDLREVLQEVALCVVQSGNETARLDMLKQRFTASSAPITNLLEQAQENTGQTEDKALNNLLTTFFIKPGERDKRGAVEFAHKSFGEYLFAERLIGAFETWTKLEKPQRFQLDEGALNTQIYDILGYGGLSQEIVASLWELLDESEINCVRLFNRLSKFYHCWCQNMFLDALPNENLPQKKLVQLMIQEIPIGLRQVDVFAGLNVMIILFKLHASVQKLQYPNPTDNTLLPELHFHPCGEVDTEDFQADRLLKTTRYADALGTEIFAKIVGSYLSRANLSRANLSGVNLSRANLSQANLSRANLSSANLDRTNFSNANLFSAYLDKANLDSANLFSANLSRANLDSAYLDRANLDSANLSSANLYSAYLDSAYLESANLDSIHLSRANLDSANLTSANLTSANLSSANLDNANLTDANLDSANLYRTNLANTNLSSATLDSIYLDSANLDSSNLTSANLSSANLSSANLSSSNLTSAILTNANLYGANLYSANLDSAYLFGTNLSNTNLSSANFSCALLIKTILSDSHNLTRGQLEGKDAPLICGASLPSDINIDPNRDWHGLAVVLHKRFPGRFQTLDDAEQWVAKCQNSDLHLWQ